MKREDYEELDRARREDRDFFDRYPDREYRLRRAWRCEFRGPSPAGFAVFAIVHRQDSNDPAALFGAALTLETNQPDGAISQILRDVQLDPHAMLR